MRPFREDPVSKVPSVLTNRIPPGAHLRPPRHCPQSARRCSPQVHHLEVVLASHLNHEDVGGAPIEVCYVIGHADTCGEGVDARRQWSGIAAKIDTVEDTRPPCRGPQWSKRSSLWHRHNPPRRPCLLRLRAAQMSKIFHPCRCPC
jgi:hypothetical protein